MRSLRCCGWVCLFVVFVRVHRCEFTVLLHFNSIEPIDFSIAALNMCAINVIIINFNFNTFKRYFTPYAHIITVGLMIRYIFHSCLPFWCETLRLFFNLSLSLCSLRRVEFFFHFSFRPSFLPHRDDCAVNELSISFHSICDATSSYTWNAAD